MTTKQIISEQFYPIIQTRKSITRSLERCEKYWLSGGVYLWGFQIVEYLVVETGEYVVEVWCGIKRGLCIARQSTIIPPDSEFSEIAYGRLDVWNSLLESLIMGGATKFYQDLVTSYRDSPTLDSAWRGSNPLTVKEATDTSKVKEEATP